MQRTVSKKRRIIGRHYRKKVAKSKLRKAARKRMKRSRTR
jgi:hypothetical protein